jgi:hypothetical protein
MPSVLTKFKGVGSLSSFQEEGSCEVIGALGGIQVRFSAAVFMFSTENG